MIIAGSVVGGVVALTGVASFIYNRFNDYNTRVISRQLAQK